MHISDFFHLADAQTWVYCTRHVLAFLSLRIIVIQALQENCRYALYCQCILQCHWLIALVNIHAMWMQAKILLAEANVANCTSRILQILMHFHCHWVNMLGHQQWGIKVYAKCISSRSVSWHEVVSFSIFGDMKAMMMFVWASSGGAQNTLLLKRGVDIRERLILHMRLQMEKRTSFRGDGDNIERCRKVLQKGLTINPTDAKLLQVSQPCELYVCSQVIVLANFRCKGVYVTCMLTNATGRENMWWKRLSSFN